MRRKCKKVSEGPLESLDPARPEANSPGLFRNMSQLITHSLLFF